MNWMGDTTVTMQNGVADAAGALPSEGGGATPTEPLGAGPAREVGTFPEV